MNGQKIGRGRGDNDVCKTGLLFKSNENPELTPRELLLSSRNVGFVINGAVYLLWAVVPISHGAVCLCL